MTTMANVVASTKPGTAQSRLSMRLFCDVCAVSTPALVGIIIGGVVAVAVVVALVVLGIFCLRKRRMVNGTVAHDGYTRAENLSASTSR
jgi:hypothetical protein